LAAIASAGPFAGLAAVAAAFPVVCRVELATGATEAELAAELPTGADSCVAVLAAASGATEMVLPPMA
jgi:hypothetical protein